VIHLLSVLGFTKIVLFKAIPELLPQGLKPTVVDRRLAGINACSTDCPTRPAIAAIAQPQLEQNDVAQLGLIAVQPSREPLQARQHAGAVNKSPLH